MNLLESSPLSYRMVSTPDQRVSGLLFETETVDPASPLVVCVHGIGSNSNYFNLKNNSLARAAKERGLSALLIDRPGYGRSLPAPPGSAIDHSVDAIRSLLQVVRADRSLAIRQVVLIGHSFGGAVALSYAALQPRDSLSAICVSGVGDRPSGLYLQERQRMLIDGIEQLPPNWFFGPGRTFDRHGVAALRAATEPGQFHESQEVAYDWPKRWASVAAEISCPIHFRLAEFERIWDAHPSDLARICSAFIRAPHLDAEILSDGGHLYEAHIRGKELVSAQLDFAQNATHGLLSRTTNDPK